MKKIFKYISDINSVEYKVYEKRKGVCEPKKFNWS
jgi:hypothetical protein